MTTAGEPVLAVEGLVTELLTPHGIRRVVDGVSFVVRAGQTLCVVGESGSGKSLTMLSLLGLHPQPPARVRAGRALLAGQDLLRLSERELAAVRGNRVGMIFQEPMSALDPVVTAGDQIAAVLVRHRGLGWREARDQAVQLLARVQIAEPLRRARLYPHELSGGMRQRVMIAAAVACRPLVLIADEPTTALDATVQAQILRLLRDLQAETGTALVLVTHDMGVVAEMADHVAVMHAGRVIESGPAREIFARPREPQTRALLATAPGGSQARQAPRPRSAEPRLEVRGLKVAFVQRSGLLQRRVGQVQAVDDVSFTLAEGETLALVGESGSGKSTTARAIMGLVRPDAGSVRLDGVELTTLGPTALRRQRRHVQMVFQDPLASLDPRWTAAAIVAEPLRLQGTLRGPGLRDRVASLFADVGLTPEHQGRYPHQLSGGQRQRLGIARAISVGPKVIVADEAVSALDPTIRLQILDLLADLQARLGLACLFITHDIGVVARIAHRTAVMRQGRIVEIGATSSVLREPRHPYTQALLASVPKGDPARRHDLAGAA